MKQEAGPWRVPRPPSAVQPSLLPASLRPGLLRPAEAWPEERQRKRVLLRETNEFLAQQMVTQHTLRSDTRPSGHMRTHSWTHKPNGHTKGKDEDTGVPAETRERSDYNILILKIPQDTNAQL